MRLPACRADDRLPASKRLAPAVAALLPLLPWQFQAGHRGDDLPAGQVIAYRPTRNP